MKPFEASYSNRRSSVVMTAELLAGLVRNNDQIIFDRWLFLPYKDETKFRCRLRFSVDAKAEILFIKSLSDIEFECPNIQTYSSTTSCDVKLSKGVLSVICHLNAQEFRRAKSTKSGNPVAYFDWSEFYPFMRSVSETLRSLETKSTPLPNPACRLQYWLSIQGPASMFVKDEHEKFESKKVISGGRPETNRRKF